MAQWFHSAEHQDQLWEMCQEHTPITLVLEGEPEYRLDCIPRWFTGDVLCVIVDQEDDGYGAKRGTELDCDPDEIADVIVREKRSDA